MVFSNESNSNFALTNVIHDDAIVGIFKDSIGKKVFILTPSYPFVFIGNIEEVFDDLLLLQVETTLTPQLENKQWHIHIHQIEVFYIEKKNGPKIPELRD